MPEVPLPAELGFYDAPGQTEPTFDPGLSVGCPICGTRLGRGEDVRTISLMPLTGTRSYFYRVHPACHNRLGDDQRQALDEMMLTGRW